MTYKLHITEKVKSVNIADFDHAKDGNKYKVTINFEGKNKLYLYVDRYDLNKMRTALNRWWRSVDNG